MCPWLRGPPIENVCRLGTPKGTGFTIFANWSALEGKAIRRAVLEADARNRGKFSLGVLPLRRDHVGGAVEREVDAPIADVLSRGIVLEIFRRAARREARPAPGRAHTPAGLSPWWWLARFRNSSSSQKFPPAQTNRRACQPPRCRKEKPPARGKSQKPILVTTPRLDCEKMPSTYGPKPYLYCCQVLELGSAPMPVRTNSPLASTTSIPQWQSKWSRIGV